jgi:Flp pilus assembly protein TadG
VEFSGIGEGKGGRPHPMTRPAVPHRKRQLRGSEEGATAVEAALVFSAFLAMILVLVDFAGAFFIWNSLQLVVGQASRYAIVQNGIPSSTCDTTCAKNALTTLLPGASSTCAGAPTSGQYCVNATCANPSACTPTAANTTMTLSALYGFKFVGLYTLTGQITVPIGAPPD